MTNLDRPIPPRHKPPQRVGELSEFFNALAFAALLPVGIAFALMDLTREEPRND